MENEMYVARYEFAGATGRSGCFKTREAAEAEADKLHAHFYGMANIWIDTQPTAAQQGAATDAKQPRVTTEGD